MERVYFVVGGSEAIEAALKLARQYFVEIGEPQRRHVIARRQSYHGNTLGALAAGGNVWRRKQFAPLLIDVSHVSPCYAYREQAAAGERRGLWRGASCAELEAEIARLGPENVIAFVAETVVGATLGAVPPVPDYFRGIREICDRHGILLILDEVMCGMGRTGTLHACEQEAVAPDLIAVAKGLGAGYQPIGALLASGKVYDAVREGVGLLPAWPHLSRASGRLRSGPRGAACAPGRNLIPQVQRLGHALEARLRARFGRTRTSATFGAGDSSRGGAGRQSGHEAAVRPGPAPERARSSSGRWRTACCVTRWAGRSTAPGGTTSCSRRPSSLPRASSTSSSSKLGRAIDAAIAASVPAPPRSR